MSAFEVSLTPTQAKKKPQSNENREPVSVIMAPFTAKSTIVFENVPVSKTARRFLIVINPTDDSLEVILSKGLRDELNVTVDWEMSRIPPQGSVQMELVWNPGKVITSSESIQFKDNRNFRKDVQIIFKSVNKTGAKNATPHPNVSSKSIKPAQKMIKSLSSHAITAPILKQQPLSKISKSDMNIFKSKGCSEHKIRADDHKDVEITSNRTNSPQTLDVPKEKENVSPVTPHNASELFDKFKFTPITETKTKQTSNLELLSSMLTPVIGKKSEGKCGDITSGSNPHRMTENFTNSSEKQPKQTTPRKTPRWIPKIVRHSCTPPPGEKHSCASAYEQHLLSATSKRPTPERVVQSSPTNSADLRRKLFHNNSPKQGINKTFELSNQSNDSLENTEGSGEDMTTESAINKTTTLPLPQLRISTIMEEDEKSDVYIKLEKTAEMVFMQKTFNVPDTNLLRDVELVGTPLRKVSESMQDLSSIKQKVATQGSMPNLNEMETIQSIEQNRYYLQVKLPADDSVETLDTSNVSTTSAQELLFDQHEILAHSSHFNVNEGSAKGSKKMACYKAPKSPKLGKQQFNKRSREPSIDSPSSVNLLSVDYYTQNACLMSVSPPKKSRMDLPEANVRPGTKIHVTKWSVTQPKKLKLIRSPQNAKKKNVTPRKIKTEPRVKLYDTDMFLQSYINPDPFAATTTFDPFLASTMYLDDGAIRKHEEQLKKWLNALVALPPDLDTDCSKKIDVGNLFNAVRNQELILAPTKEEQSMNYLTKSRMEALRKAAVNLYMSQEMVEICSKVAIHINKHSIEIRKDRDLHLDVVLQRYILELLLSFNPLWLRLGLEVVFGEVIHLHSNSDILGLSTFILNRLFRDRFLEQKHSRAFTLSEKYAVHIKKMSLQKILLLLLFLDKAKSKRIIKHNPCLFVVTSKYKETKEILLRFSSELLANIGDITRNLRRLGYVLTHRQSYIDEFNYAFKNLAVDLRDGVRLTRVMEIILLRDDLTTLLRVPAISRTQRVFNVNLGLRALAEANFTLTGGISAYDIVDGHREKTLSLLWQIIYKFRSPKFHAAASVIQKWWRNCWLEVVIRRRIRIKIERRRNEAATKIQSAYKGHLARMRVGKWKKECVMAIITLQKYVRGFLCRRRLEKTVYKVTLIQRWFRATKLKRIERANYLELKHAAIKIQTWYRRVILSRKLVLAAVIVKEVKQTAKLQYEKAIIIQRSVKSYIIRTKLRSLVHQILDGIRAQKVEHKSAVLIQSFFRMIVKRKQYSAQRESAIQIQRVWRSYKLAQIVHAKFLEQRRAAITIQRYFRGFMAMKLEQLNFQKLRASAIITQRRYRATMQAKRQRQEFLSLKAATITIQKRFRATMLMREDRSKYIKLLHSVKYVQQKYRAKILMRRERDSYEKLKLSTITIQKYLRATLLARKIRLEYLSIQYHTILIQQRFRAKRLMRKDKSHYLHLKSAVLSIQRHYRATLAMRADREKYLMQKNAVVVLQTRLRAQWKMQSQRMEFLCIRKSVLIIQLRFRATQAMKLERSRFLHLRLMTVTVQRRYRANKLMQKARKEFRSLRTAAIFIQRRFRSNQEMKKQRNEYLSLRKATRIIQQRFRAQKCMRIAREKYKIYQSKAIVIQRYIRGYLQMKRVREVFLQQRMASIKIQTWWRGVLLHREERQSYLKTVTVVRTLQIRWRAKQIMRATRQEYLEKREKIICIQRYFRAYLLMKAERHNYFILKQAAICLQQRFRARQQMLKHRNNFVALRTAIIKIQQRFRSVRIMKPIRQQYLQLRQAAIFIQQKFRARKLYEVEHEAYNRIRHATVNLQRYIRGHLARKRFSDMLTPERREEIRRRNAARIIQKYWRGYWVRKHLHSKKFESMRNRLKVLKAESKPANTIRHQILVSVQILKQRYYTSELLAILVRLENLSRVVPKTLKEHATFIASFAYGIMAQANRSEPDKQVIELCSRIILNFSRYGETKEDVFQESGLVTIAQMLLRWSDKDCPIFNTLCTLVWVFIHCEEKKKVIREFMTTREATFMLRETKKMILRKEKMRIHSRKPNLQQLSSPKLSRQALPHLETDFGIAKKSPYVFGCSVFALDAILLILGISV